MSWMSGWMACTLILGFGPVWAQSLQPQEIERDLLYMPMEEIAVRDMRPSDLAGTNHRGSALSLPFFDDFSTLSMPLSDGTLPGFEAFQRWETGSARRTETFAINAPTIGAATLDGLNRFGEPYNFVEVNTPGWCDTLTSLPIALNGYFPESNVLLRWKMKGIH